MFQAAHDADWKRLSPSTWKVREQKQMLSGLQERTPKHSEYTR